MLDIILYAPTGKAALVDFARNHPPANPLLDDEGNTREGVSYCWWAGEGKFKTVKETIVDGVVTVPATFLPGVVALLRIHSDFFASQKLADQAYDENGQPQIEQWQRSAVVKYIKDNGTPGTMGGIPYVNLAGVRIFRPQDVATFLAARNLPGHEWLDGNAY